MGVATMEGVDGGLAVIIDVVHENTHNPSYVLAWNSALH